MPVSRRRTSARLAIAAGIVVPAMGLVALFAITAEAAQPQAPSSFHGLATIDGQLPPEDAEVRGFVDGVDCTQAEPGSPSTVRVGETAAYVISVVHEDQRRGCGREGKTVTFTVGGHPANRVAEWKIGLQHLNLDAAADEVQSLSRIRQMPGEGDATSALRESAADGSSGFPLLATVMLVLGAMAVTGTAARLALRRRPAGQDPASGGGDGDGGPGAAS